jgi:hypothetical protein
VCLDEDNFFLNLPPEIMHSILGYVVGLYDIKSWGCVSSKTRKLASCMVTRITTSDATYRKIVNDKAIEDLINLW